MYCSSLSKVKAVIIESPIGSIERKYKPVTVRLLTFELKSTIKIPWGLISGSKIYPELEMRKGYKSIKFVAICL